MDRPKRKNSDTSDARPNKRQRHEKLRKFEYEPLEDAGSQIRLVKVLPGDPDHVVQLSIQTYDRSNAPEYYAISYTWGEKVPTTTIHIDNKEHNVRTNCHYALWQTRLHYPACYVWIDAICINQDDVREKSSQVQSFEAVFSGAALVLACVGPHANESKSLIRIAKHMLKELYDWAPANTVKLYLKTSGFVKFEERENGGYVIYGLWEQYIGREACPKTLRWLTLFSQRKYWKRLWILQEVCVAKEKAILCGTDTMPWDGLSVLISIKGQGPRPANAWPSLDFEKVWNTSNEGKMPLDVVLSEHGRWLCEDLRDRVYGVHALVDWTRSSLATPVPNYDLSPVELCKGMIRNFKQGFPWHNHLVELLLALNINADSPEISRDGTDRETGMLSTMSQSSQDPRDWYASIYLYCTVATITRSSDGALSVPIYENRFAKSVSLPTDTELDCQLIVADSQVAAIACSATREGDLLIEFQGLTNFFVVRPRGRERPFDLIGYALRRGKSSISLPDLHEDSLVDKHSKSNSRYGNYGNVEICLTPEDWLLLYGQDRSLRDSRDASALLRRLNTPLATFPEGAVRLEYTRSLLSTY